MPTQTSQTSPPVERIAFMEFKARQLGNGGKADTIRSGIDAMLSDHPGVIFQASILCGRMTETPEETLVRLYDGAGLESYRGYVQCVICRDDGRSGFDAEDKPVCQCEPARN